MKKIIYPNPNGGLYIVFPTGELPFEEVCRKDVPAGTPYLVVTDENIPSDYTFFKAWEADFSNPDGYGIGSDAWIAQQEAEQ